MPRHQPLVRIPVTPRSAVPAPAPPVAKARTDEGEAPSSCRRCQLSGQPCVFEKPEKKNGQLLSTASVDRLSRLEGHFPLYAFPHVTEKAVCSSFPLLMFIRVL
ncbi:hypothetical protein BGY98DRAFT_682067 [Russula aff. rugulosa BPL654]|nr:hypothetical protein BGY98DRAFT_682067 [Russula aff. rugulosa BPL654]